MTLERQVAIVPHVAYRGPKEPFGTLGSARTKDDAQASGR